MLTDITDKVEKIFYRVLTTIYLSWDPDKDPTMPTGLGPDHHNLPPQTLEKHITYGRQQTITPVALFRPLEELLRRADLVKPG